MQVSKPFLLCVSFVMTSCSLNIGQEDKQPPLALILMEMAAHDRYESGSIGFTALKSKQNERFEQLISVTTADQLLDLAANHTNGVVRLYSYQALLRRKEAILEKPTRQFRNDTTKIRVFIGCIMDIKPISALIQGQIIRSNITATRPSSFQRIP